jgi:hypothetical protein
MGDNKAPLTADSHVARAETALSAEVGGELVALDVNRGVCYGLNPVGTRIWQLLETPRFAREIIDTLLSEYEISPEVCAEQTLNLLRDLLAAELVVTLSPLNAADEAILQAHG